MLSCCDVIELQCVGWKTTPYILCFYSDPAVKKTKENKKQKARLFQESSSSDYSYYFIQKSNNEFVFSRTTEGKPDLKISESAETFSLSKCTARSRTLC